MENIRLCFLSIFIFNVVGYWWLWYASYWATFGAWGANAALMALPFLAFIIQKSLKSKFLPIDFVCWWLTFEYIHMSWEFSWPWLNIGNVLSFTPKLAQWYEYTGAFGGSLWILTDQHLFIQFHD